MKHLTLAMGLVAICASPALADDAGAPAPPAEREKAIHVLSRCAFGPTPELLAKVEKMGVRAWLEAQLAPEKIDDSALEKRLAGLESLGKGTGALMREYNPQPADDSEAEQRRVERLRATPGRELKTAVLLRACYSERQLQEVMVEFWRNHLNVSLKKDEVAYLAPDYEREVIRKHVFGRFEEMLLASAKHAAMLIYLDQQFSQRPLTPTEEKYLKKAGGNLSAAQKQLVRQRGLNENYARELLELHTLGVDNGYTQRDVIEVARALTGWTVDRNGDGGNYYGFWFHKDVHDTDAKYVLGASLPRRAASPEEGEAVIRGVARHRNTSRFIAFKMCRYLVADRPPEALVERVAKVFRDTDGDLRAVTRAIVLDDEFLARAHFQAKFKTPFEYVVSLIRVTTAEVRNPEPVLHALHLMGQPIYGCDDPTGYYDTREAWLDPGVLALRWQIALDLCEGRGGGAVRVPDAFFARPGPLDADPPKLNVWLARSGVLPAGADPSLLATLSLAVGDGKFTMGDDALRRRVIGLALGSPQFQKQ